MTNDGKTQAWRNEADRLLESLARENRYIVAKMLIPFLEKSGYALDDYTSLNGVFLRAAKKGTIKQVKTGTRPNLWESCIYTAI